MAADEAALAAAGCEAEVRAGLWEVLARQAALYTLGESTSLPEYDAHRLLASACYVLGIDPDDPDPALMGALAAEGVAAAFDRRLRRIEEASVAVGHLWRDVCLSMPLLESVALKDTLQSLRDFGARYEPRFFAHEIPADIDYPLSRPVPESTLGVDYVTAYLEQLLEECRFLQALDIGGCRKVLHAVHHGYGELILNLFEPVAANATGCVLAGCPARSLALGDEGRERIAEQLGAVSPRRWPELLDEAALAACDQLGFRAATDEGVREAVRHVAVGLVPRLRTALRYGSLEGVFPR